jgi:hypothetical protein
LPPPGSGTERDDKQRAGDQQVPDGRAWCVPSIPDLGAHMIHRLAAGAVARLTFGINRMRREERGQATVEYAGLAMVAP